MSFRVPETDFPSEFQDSKSSFCCFFVDTFFGDTVLFIGFYSNFYVTVAGVADCRWRLHHTAPTGDPVPGVLS